MKCFCWHWQFYTLEHKDFLDISFSHLRSAGRNESRKGSKFPNNLERENSKKMLPLKIVLELFLNKAIEQVDNTLHTTMKQVPTLTIIQSIMYNGIVDKNVD